MRNSRQENLLATANELESKICINHNARRSRAEWREIVQAYESSGLKGKSYCQERGLSVHQFRWWVRQFRQEPEVRKFVELRLPQQSSANNSEYKIKTLSGRELWLQGSFSMERAKQLLALLESE